MKKTFFLLALVATLSLSAQVTTIPATIPLLYADTVTVIFNPNQGNGGMKSATSCYAHTGVTVNGNKWQKTGTWRDGEAKYKMTKNKDGNWVLKIAPNIQTYYGLHSMSGVTQLCFVFNDGPSGSKEGKTSSGGDIFVDLVDTAHLSVKMTPKIGELTGFGSTFSFTCTASRKAALTLTINDQVVKQEQAQTMSYDYTFSQSGSCTIVFSAQDGDQSAQVSYTTSVPAQPVQEARPKGIDMGIYYDANNPTKVTLCTYAASKTEAAKHVFLVGDMNNWKMSDSYQLKQDGNYFWITLTNMPPGVEMAFQYVVVRPDGVVKRISDLYSEKVLCPEDNGVPKSIDPTLKSYPTQADGYCSVFQTNKPTYKWSDATLNFKRPDKNNLVIYELWVYDHTPKRSYEGLLTRLDYFKDLGVNCIELMPVNEFDGNNSWGYSPNHYFALDKAYGTPKQLKTFIDSCHARGIAVVLDMVFNHATGNNPMNKLYPYGELEQNPWFNAKAPHPDNVYEDWNHDFAPAHSMFIRALQYWLTEYKIDGYRMDLSHGLCGTSYNAVANLKDYYDKGVKAVSADAYMMLEHWGSYMSSDRPQLVNYGMMCWQNTSNAYCQTAMGWLKDGDSFNDANKDGYVSYCENHDEERCFFKAKQFGNGSDLKNNDSVRISRVPLNMAFLTLLNGPHLFYHFAELGFDYSKFQNSSLRWGKDGVDAYGKEVATNALTTEEKMSTKYSPENHNWFQQGIRMRTFQQVAQINQLRTRLLPDVFAGNPTSVNVASGANVRTIRWGNDVFVAGNFSTSSNQPVQIPSNTWYNYFAGTQQTTSTVVLKPGELLILTGKYVALPQVPDHYNFTATDIDDIFPTISSSSSSYKVLRDGHIRVVRDGVYYSIMGQRIQ